MRGRAIVRIGAVVGTLSAVALQFPPGQDPFGKIVATCALSAIAVASTALLVAERFGQPIDPRRVFWLSLVISPAIITAMWHLGVMSPTVMGLIFGIYYFGLSDQTYEGWVNYLVSSIGFGLLTGLTVTGVTPADRAVFAPVTTDPTAIVPMAIIVELMLLVTFSLARLSRRATIDAMVKLEQARRQIQERDVLLDEAAADLHVAVGRRGRYTGTVLAGWTLDEVIGRGAMGEVYRGHRQSEQAAVKVLHAFYASSADHVERFLREAQVSIALESPHIVEVHEHGKTPDGCPFFLMELLEGHDLAWHLRQRRRFAMKDTLVLIDEIARALSIARDSGVVHRDVKPKNVFLDERSKPVWKVLDFGVSKLRESSGTLTQDNIVGTPAYMAPEQAKQTAVDHRADVFALGAIAYRVITGRPAFYGDQPMTIMFRVTKYQPHRPSAIVRLPEDVDLILALALAKDRDRRLSSAATFAAALRDAARNELDDRFRDDARALLAEQPWEPLPKA